MEAFPGTDSLDTSTFASPESDLRHFPNSKVQIAKCMPAASSHNFLHLT